MAPFVHPSLRCRSKWDICGPLHFVALHFSKQGARREGGRPAERGVVCQAVIAVLNLLFHLVCKKCIVSPSLSIPQHRLSSFIRLPQPPPPSDDMLSLMAMASLPPSLSSRPPARVASPLPSLGRHFFAPFCRAAIAAISSAASVVGVDALESYHCRQKPWPEYKGVRERNPAVRRPQGLGRQGGRELGKYLLCPA